MRNLIVFILTILMAAGMLLKCKSSEITKSDLPILIIPKPLQVEKKMGKFVLEKNTIIVLPSENEEWKWVGNYLSEKIKPATGFILQTSTKKGISSITFENSKSINHPEGYELSIDPFEIIIRSQDARGAFYAVQTLLQLFPESIFKKEQTENILWTVPCVRIVDEPRFPYRGLHLDVARHFFGVEEVKKYIDLLVLHKMNHFHWHLTEDQGWRIEIKKYPKLTEIGAFREGTLVGHYNDQPHQFDGKRYGGFYTQEEIKEVVEYANQRFVTIIPEIEMPGHSQAALASYPELGCTGGPFKVMQKWGVSENVYCPKEETFEFLENVLEEVIALFPGKYIHIGGDECPKTRWKESAFCQQLIKKEGLKDEHELQSWFIRKIEKFVNSKGRRIIGWDEILEGGLAPNATVMSWRGVEGGIEAARSGHDVIMTPTSHCYLDYYQSDNPDEPLAIGGLLPLEKVYSYEPVPEELNESEARHILGTQGNVWTEYIKTFDKVEYMTYPRACALAEIGWTSKNLKDFSDFGTRLTHHLKRFDAIGVNAANHLYELKPSIQPSGKSVIVVLETLDKNFEIFYTNDGSEPSENSLLYQTPVEIMENSILKVQVFSKGKKVGRSWQQTIEMHKAAGKTILLTHDPEKKYSGGGNGSIINGVKGSSDRYGDKEWLGFSGKDFEAVIDLGKSEKLNYAKLRFFNGEGQWIYLPKKVIISVSEDGENFTEAGNSSNISGQEKVSELMVPLKNVRGQFVKIFAKRFGIIPAGNQGEGNEAWLFVDEIVIN